jgi:hypothetical protein
MTKFTILVLSATGAPAPLVKRFVLDITVPCVAWRADGFAFGVGELGKRNGLSESAPSQSARIAV